MDEKDKLPESERPEEQPPIQEEKPLRKIETLEVSVVEEIKTDER